MDFVTHFPWTSRGNEVVWVIMGMLTKSAHFLPMRMTFTLEAFCRLYIQEIVQLHGVPSLTYQTGIPVLQLIFGRVSN